VVRFLDRFFPHKEAIQRRGRYSYSKTGLEFESFLVIALFYFYVLLIAQPSKNTQVRWAIKGILWFSLDGCWVPNKADLSLPLLSWTGEKKKI